MSIVRLSTEKYTQIISYLLVIGLSLFLTGYFWQESSSRLQTMYYLLVVIPVFLTLPHQLKSYPFNSIFMLAAVLVLYTAVSVFWSDNLSGDAIFHQFKKVILLLCLFLSVYSVTTTFPRFENFILPAMLFVGTILAIYNIYFMLVNEGLTGRIYGWGVLNNANITAEVFGLLFLFALLEFLKTSNKRLMLLYLSILSILAIEIILNKSRGQQLALFIAIGLILFSTRREQIKKLIPVAVAAVMLLIFLALFTDVTEQVLNRELNFSCRDVIWKELLNTAMNTPYFGRGAGSESGFAAYCEPVDTTYTHAHSVYMAIFLYTGLVGVILALWLTVKAIVTALGSRHEYDLFWALIIIYGFIAFLPNGDMLVSRPNERWMLFWIPVAFIASRKKTFRHFQNHLSNND